MQALPLQDLLEGLVRTLIEAQTQAARASLDFIESIGFNREEKTGDHWGSTKLVTFCYPHSDGNNAPTTRTVSVPLLSLVSIPFARIESVEYEFFANVSEVSKKHVQKNRPVSDAAPQESSEVTRLDLLCEVAPYPLEDPKLSKIPMVHVKLIVGQTGLPAEIASRLHPIEETSGEDIATTKK
jgi:hypothetical protein